LPKKMSGEKVNTMKCLGAEILRTPTEAAWDAEDSHIFLSARLAKELNGHVLDQYLNAGNPLAHYDGTAEEIIQQTNGKLDYMIMTTGTGGTLSGTAKKLKEQIPDIKIVGQRLMTRHCAATASADPIVQLIKWKALVMISSQLCWTGAWLIIG